MTDLETAIRDALHARADTMPIRHSTLVVRRRRWLPPTLAAALVIALVAITLAVLARSEHHTAPPAAGKTAQFVGQRWRLVRIDDPQGRLDLPATTHASVTFERGGRMIGDDTVHGLDARYRLVPGGYDPSELAETANGLAGPVSGALKRTLAAVGSCFSSPGSDGKPPSITPVRAAVHGDRLVLHTTYGVLTFVRAGPAPTR